MQENLNYFYKKNSKLVFVNVLREYSNFYTLKTHANTNDTSFANLVTHQTPCCVVTWFDLAF